MKKFLIAILTGFLPFTAGATLNTQFRPDFSMQISIPDSYLTSSETEVMEWGCPVSELVKAESGAEAVRKVGLECVEEAKRATEKYCAYQERCHKEVEQKLYDLNMIPEARDLIIVHLIEHNFLNEERFSKSYARGKFRIKKWGKQRITRELKFRNISSICARCISVNNIKS